jgi:hypothetical protein
MTEEKAVTLRSASALERAYLLCVNEQLSYLEQWVSMARVAAANVSEIDVDQGQ